MARRILIGISGSIAAVKSPELVRLLVDKGYDVDCVLTKGASHFVAPLALATFSGHAVVEEMFGDEAWRMPHLRLAENADVMVIAPATALILGRCANGLTEDMVTLSYLTTTAPVLIAPAMHPTMWEHAATQTNVKTLRERGATFVGPYIGPLADKTHGEGRMSEPVEILQAIEKILDNTRSKKA
jgi:phosphopantothenoylcysteine decarboxylase / phosphopantothenate---cysteine ligase